jgi:hypothetical protein
MKERAKAAGQIEADEGARPTARDWDIDVDAVTSQGVGDGDGRDVVVCPLPGRGALDADMKSRGRPLGFKRRGGERDECRGELPSREEPTRIANEEVDPIFPVVAMAVWGEDPVGRGRRGQPTE